MFYPVRCGLVASLLILAMGLLFPLHQHAGLISAQACGNPLTKESAPFCFDVVSWMVHMETYARDATGPDNVAKAYYEGKIAAVPNASDQCRARVKQVACGRNFLLCVSRQAPHIQLCNMVCQSAINECGEALDFSDQPCRLDNTDCHTRGTASSTIASSLSMLLPCFTFVILQMTLL